ncbi:hypothetical protein DXG01_006441 [Tephrocybe rancida]|nr:hypothetical protein DXG01_006441 [Tephrocybe rancida]
MFQSIVAAARHTRVDAASRALARGTFSDTMAGGLLATRYLSSQPVQVVVSVPLTVDLTNSTDISTSIAHNGTPCVEDNGTLPKQALIDDSPTDLLNQPSVLDTELGSDSEEDLLPVPTRPPSPVDPVDPSIRRSCTPSAASLPERDVETVLGNIFGSRTVVESDRQLLDGLDLIALCDALDPGAVPKPATTFKIVKWRLGLDAGAYIVQIPICTSCFKPYTHDEIKNAPNPNCTERRCTGKFYRKKQTAGITDGNSDDSDSAKIKHIPAKIHCYSPIEKTVAQLLLCKDFVENLQDTSKDMDRAPITEHTVMHDIHDAEGWTSLEIGM